MKSLPRDTSIRRPRACGRLALAALLCCVSAVGCLVTVDASVLDALEADASGVDATSAEAEPEPQRVPIDAAREAGADARVDAAAEAAAPTEGCVGYSLGNYCGRSLPLYTGSGQDLVRCSGDDKISSIDACAGGCVIMPPNRRDVCDPCAPAPNGSYCVKQLVPDYNMPDVLMTCSGGKVVTSGGSAPKICGGGCASTGSFGACQ